MFGRIVNATEWLRRLMEHRSDLAVLVLLPAWIGVLYSRVLDMWWTADDPMVLWHVHRFGPSDYFFGTETWRSFNAASLTPWMHLSFDVDLSIFGLSPCGYYLHQLIAVAVAAWSLYFCLRLYLAVGPAAAGALGLVASPAIAEICGFLATRHYPEGLVFACVSFALFVLSIRWRNWRLVVVASVCYAFALTAKEIYAPLPLLLLFLPEGEFRARLKRIAGYVPVVVGYMAWRGLMLGSVVGGFRDRFLPTMGELSAWASGVVESAGVSPFVLVFILSVLVSVAGVMLYRCREGWRGFWVVFAVCAAIPVIPVLHVYSPRHSLGPMILVAAVFAALVEQAYRWRSGAVLRWVVALACGMVLVVAGAASHAQLPSPELTQRIQAEGEPVLSGDDPGVVVVSPVMPYWHFFGLFQLRDEVLNLGVGPGVVADSCFFDLAVGPARMKTVRSMVFDPDSGELAAMANDRECRTDTTASLAVDIEFNSGTTSWNFGPYTTGRYTVLWAVSDNSFDRHQRSAKRQLARQHRLRDGSRYGGGLPVPRWVGDDFVPGLRARREPEGWELAGHGELRALQLRLTRVGNPRFRSHRRR